MSEGWLNIVFVISILIERFEYIYRTRYNLEHPYPWRQTDFFKQSMQRKSLFLYNIN
jgi:hypothetical protein